MAGKHEIIGQGWAFPVNVGNRGQIEILGGNAKICQAIHIILNTAPGERVMCPEFGCRIHEVIFWPANSSTGALVERYVTEALAQWEPRIEVLHVTATPGNLAADIDVFSEAGLLFIEIVYQIKGQHDKRSLVYPFYLSPA